MKTNNNLINFEIQWQELTSLQDLLNEAQHNYFSLRAKYYARIKAVKKFSKSNRSWKQFSTEVRSKLRTIKNKMNIPKGYSVDHKCSVLFAFCNNWTVEQTNAASNLQVIPMKENRDKGIKCDFS